MIFNIMLAILMCGSFAYLSFKVHDSKILLLNYKSILRTNEKNINTNIFDKEITNLIKMQVKNMPKWTIKKYNLNGQDSSNYTHSMRKMKIYVMKPDYNTVTNASIYIKSLVDNKTFNEIEI